MQVYNSNSYTTENRNIRQLLLDIHKKSVNSKPKTLKNSAAISFSPCTLQNEKKCKKACNSSNGIAKNGQQLPQSIAELMDILKNIEAIFSIVKKFGGCTIHIPTTWPPFGKTSTKNSHPLRSIISTSQMQSIVKHYAGTDIYIPRCSKAVLVTRNLLIIKTFTRWIDKGLSSCEAVRTLAQKHSLTERRIWTILNNNTSTKVNIKEEIPEASAYYIAPNIENDPCVMQILQ